MGREAPSLEDSAAASRGAVIVPSSTVVTSRGDLAVGRGVHAGEAGDRSPARGTSGTARSSAATAASTRAAGASAEASSRARDRAGRKLPSEALEQCLIEGLHRRMPRRRVAGEPAQKRLGEARGDVGAHLRQRPGGRAWPSG